LRESGSVRRAEELARRMKSKSDQSIDKSGSRKMYLRVVSAELDKMQEDLAESFNKDLLDGQRKTKVNIVRSQRETKITFVFPGGLEETQPKFMRVYKSITS